MAAMRGAGHRRAMRRETRAAKRKPGYEPIGALVLGTAGRRDGLRRMTIAPNADDATPPKYATFDHDEI